MPRESGSIRARKPSELENTADLGCAGGGRGNCVLAGGVIFTGMDTVAITAYIELNLQVRFGKPVVKGTRTTVAEVLEMLANGMSAADIAEDFPAIGAAQVRACLLYAAYRERIVLQAAA